MVDFGFFDDWNPRSGRITAWAPTNVTRTAVAAAPSHSSPPSYAQREYLRTAHRNSGMRARTSRLCMFVFDVPGRPDIDALTRTFTAFTRRHDTFWSRFEVSADQSVRRYVVAPERIELAPTDHGIFEDIDAIRDFVQDSTPDARSWDCFGFGVIERPESFTMYAAVDHLHTDGVGQALTCMDLLLLYSGELSGIAATPTPVDGHLDYCARELATNQALSLESPQVVTWRELLRRNGNAMPSFPLPLAAGNESGYSRGAQLTMPLLTGDDAIRFEAVCEQHGGRFLGGLLTVMALAEHELTGAERYFVLTPANTRATPGEAGSIGWYTNLVPVATDLPADVRFSTLVARSQRAADEARHLTEVSPHRVLDLVGSDLDIAPGWAAMMLSFVDVRKIEGVEMFDQMNGGMFANRAAPGQVYVWVNRFPDVTTLSLLFPDTVVAHDSVERYVKIFSSIVDSVVAEGDFIDGRED